MIGNTKGQSEVTNEVEGRHVNHDKEWNTANPLGKQWLHTLMPHEMSDFGTMIALWEST